MERTGETASAVAFNAAMTPLGIVVSSPLISRYGTHLSVRAGIAMAIGLSIVILLLIGLVQNSLAWLPLRFLLGCTINVVYVLSEATLLTIAPSSHRGRLMGAYTSITTAGYAIGPMLLVLVGSDGMAPFMVLAAILVVAMTPFFFVAVERGGSTEGQETAVPLLVFLRSGGLLVAAYASTTLFDNGFMTLFPGYGLDVGLNETAVSGVLFFLLLGGAIFQVPLGWMVDRTSVVTGLAICTLIGLAGFPVFEAVMPVAVPAMAVAFLWGGAVLGVQTVALVEMGRRYAGAMLLTGNSTLALMWGVSSIIGIPVTGYTMDRIGPHAILFVIGGLFAITAPAFAVEVRLRERRGSGSVVVRDEQH